MILFELETAPVRQAIRPLSIGSGMRACDGVEGGETGVKKTSKTLHSHAPSRPRSLENARATCREPKIRVAESTCHLPHSTP